MDFDFLDNKSRYIKAIGLYFFCFYILSIFITLFLKNFYLSDINQELYTQIISGNILDYLKEPYIDTTIKILKFLAMNNFLIYITLIFMCITVFYKDFIVDSFSLNDKNFLKKLLIYLLIFYLFEYLIAIIVNVLSVLFNIEESINQQMLVVMLDYSPILIIISAGILGPIVEELIFRKAIFGIFSNKKIALLISTISFGIIHIISSIGSNSLFEILILTIPYMSAGFIFGYIYLKTDKNIYYVTLIHMISNLLSIALLLVF